MELKEFVEVFKKYFYTFVIVFAIVLLAGLIWRNFQAKFYLASVAVNISREGQVKNKDYQYDQFYQLQADEKFGKNIVNWLGDPGFLEASKHDFKTTKIGKQTEIYKLKATQLSSNYIKVEYKTKNPQAAVLFGKILKKNLNDKNEKLNIGGNENWFKLIIDDAHVEKSHIGLTPFLIVLSVLGSLFGLLGVLLRHYFNFSENENRN